MVKRLGEEKAPISMASSWWPAFQTEVGLPHLATHRPASFALTQTLKVYAHLDINDLRHCSLPDWSGILC